MDLEEFLQTEHAKKPHFLLLGNPVAHSFSPLMHNTAASYHNLPERYFAIKMLPSKFGLLGACLNNKNLKGINVTIPYKHKMLGYLDEIDAACKQIGAVNVLVKNKGGWKGFNTDAYGFKVPLKPYVEEIAEKGAIIFGTGGASKAAVYSLNEMEIDNITLVSRKPNEASDELKQSVSRIISYENWTKFVNNSKLIVNTTPLGMKPYLNRSPVKESEIDYLNEMICYDLIYNPPETKFLKLADRTGAITINGLEMLIHQGSKIFELWTGKKFPIPLIREKMHEKIKI